MHLLWIGAAGAAGAVARYLVATFVTSRSATSFPWGTLLVNVSGCFLLGLLVEVLATRFAFGPTTRSTLTVGFLGAYTTFSTFALETIHLRERSGAGLALGYIVASTVLGITAAWLGTVLGRAA